MAGHLSTIVTAECCSHAKLFLALSCPCDAQRLRDQIRGWAVLPEVRDPAQLHDARRSIEQDMVRR